MGRRNPPPDTLAALATLGLPIYIECAACNHYRKINFYELAKELSWRATVKEIEARHRCSHCGRKLARVRRG